MKYIIFTAAAAMLLLTLYLITENTLIMRVRHKRFGKGVRIMHISDIHKRRFGKNNCRISDAAKREKPDMTFITGDLVSRKETDFSASKKLLKELCEVAPVYFIYGNHEQSLITEELQKEFADMIDHTGVILLRNETVKAEVNGRSFNICGIEPVYTIYKKEENRRHYKDLDVITLIDMKKLVGDCPAGETLLLAHNPFFGSVYAEWGADYTFSGHVHGGVVRLFGIAMLSPERKFFPKYAKGAYDIGGKKLLVSGGLGKLRAFNPPEILIYEI